jgi:hypothetical protein
VIKACATFRKKSASLKGKEEWSIRNLVINIKGEGGTAVGFRVSHTTPPHLSVGAGCRADQRRLRTRTEASACRLQVQVEAGVKVQEDSNDILTAGACSQMQRSVATRRRCATICAVHQEELDGRCASLCSRKMQRGMSIRLPGVYLGAVLEEQAAHDGAASGGSVGERRIPCGVGPGRRRRK